MIKWRDAYLRQKNSPEFRRYYGQGVLMPSYAFRPISFVQHFQFAAGAGVSPPTLQNFPAGAIILGITAAAFLRQQAAGVADYQPSPNPGLRNLFGLSFQYTNDELITPQGPGIADGLLGSGAEDEWPHRELLIAPSQGLLCTAQALTPLGAAAPNQFFVDVFYHSMVPRAVG